MNTTILVKNATLWQWDEGKCGEMRPGHAIQKSWFAIDKGIITDSSSNSMDSGKKQLPSEVNFGTIIDVKHQLVIPGLNDAHIHVAMTGESNYFLNLKGCDSIEKLIKDLSEHSAKFPKAVLPWISGINWDQVEIYSLKRYSPNLSKPSFESRILYLVCNAASVTVTDDQEILFFSSN